ncbi:hypothetical protein [Leptospira noguchii]
MGAIWFQSTSSQTRGRNVNLKRGNAALLVFQSTSSQTRGRNT